MTGNLNDRFDRLLGRMANGQPPVSAGKKPSSDQASGEAPDACCSDIQTPQILREMLPADVNVGAVNPAL